MSPHKQTTRTDDSFVELNREAFEVGTEMQMAMLEASARLATEFTSFMAKRAQATARDMARLATATTPRELASAQFDRMNAMVRDYAHETGRLMEIAVKSAHEGGAGIRSSFFEDEAPRH